MVFINLITSLRFKINIHILDEDNGLKLAPWLPKPVTYLQCKWNTLDSLAFSEVKLASTKIGKSQTFFGHFEQNAHVKISNKTLIRIMHKRESYSRCNTHLSQHTHRESVYKSRAIWMHLPGTQARNFVRCQFQSQFNAKTIFLPSFLINNKLISQNTVYWPCPHRMSGSAQWPQQQ